MKIYFSFIFLKFYSTSCSSQCKNFFSNILNFQHFKLISKKANVKLTHTDTPQSNRLISIVRSLLRKFCIILKIGNILSLKSIQKQTDNKE